MLGEAPRKQKRTNNLALELFIVLLWETKRKQSRSESVPRVSVLHNFTEQMQCHPKENWPIMSEHIQWYMGFSIPLASILINNAGDSSMVEKVI
jgi:hypothetical protein